MKEGVFWRGGSLFFGTQEHAGLLLFFLLFIEVCQGIERYDEWHDDGKGLISIDADRAFQAAVIGDEIPVLFIDKVAKSPA